MARTLVRAVSRPFVVEEHVLSVGLSIGIAIAPRDGSTSDLLLREADLALYHSKAQGGASHSFYSCAPGYPVDPAVAALHRLKEPALPG